MYDASNCNADGFALATCDSIAANDESSCTNCTALGMFVSADRSMCTGGCSPGEVALAGPPGATVCSPCDAGTHQSGAECVACAHDASSCIGDGVAVAECGSGEASDVSSCTNCTILGMFVSADRSTCTGNCSAGEVALAGPPGEMMCANCTSVGLVLSSDGETCEAPVRLLSGGGENDGEGLSGGGIAGVAIGLGVAALLAWFLLKRRPGRKISGSMGDDSVDIDVVESQVKRQR